MQNQDDQDQGLLRQIAQEDERALRDLMDRYGGVLMRYAGTYLKDEALCEDVIQHVFLQVWRHAANWKPTAKVRTWLYTICYRRCISVLRSRPVMQNIVDIALVDDTADTGRIMHNKDQKQSIEIAMKQLPERQKIALLLRFGDEMSQKEAASVMDISEKAFESLFSRAKINLRQELEHRKEELL